MKHGVEADPHAGVGKVVLHITWHRLSQPPPGFALWRADVLGEMGFQVLWESQHSHQLGTPWEPLVAEFPFGFQCLTHFGLGSLKMGVYTEALGSCVGGSDVTAVRGCLTSTLRLSVLTCRL